MKKVLNYIFIDGLSGMALGLFATLIIGTIIKQIGSYIPGFVGTYLIVIGQMASSITGAGIGCGVAVKFKEKPLVIFSAAVCGMIGAFAGNIIAGTVLVEGVINYKGPGEPLGAYIAALVGITVGRLVAGKTKLDILVTPSVTILSGATAGILLGPPISGFMTWLGGIVNWSTERQPLVMGILVSVIMGMRPSAAELIGRVSTIPMMTDTSIPITSGCLSVLQLTIPPSHVMNPEMGGPSSIPAVAPDSIVTEGVTRISSFVFPATSLPTVIPTSAAI